MKKATKLKLQKVVKVKPTKPFAFDPTFHKPDQFRHFETMARIAKALGVSIEDLIK